MKLSELYLNRYLYKDNNQDLETKDSIFNSLDNSDTEPASIPSGGAAQDINTGNVLLNQNIIPSTTLNVANWGWGQSCVFTADDRDTVSWGGGTFTSANGDSYTIASGTTGNISAKTYIYLSLLDSETEYQTTTISTNAVGLGKVLIAVAEDADTATPQPDATYNLTEASQIVADNILANSIDATKMNVGVLSAITANIGNITAGSLTGLTITGGTIRTDTIGTRVEMNGDDNRLDIYSGSDKRMSLDGDSLEFYNSSGTKTATLQASSSYGFLLNGSYSNFQNVIRYNATYGLFVQSGLVNVAKFYNGGFQMYNGATINTYDVLPNLSTNADIGSSSNPYTQGHFTDLFVYSDLTVTDDIELGDNLIMQPGGYIQDVSRILWDDTNANPTGDGTMLYFDNGTSEGLRMQFGGSDFQFDASGV